MVTGRREHNATLLTNGKVLVTGGNRPDLPFGVLASAELYDPVAGNWTGTGSLTTARADHTATLLPNGKVLVAGGFQSTLRDHMTYTYLNSAEIYDSPPGAWSPTGSMSTVRSDHTATLLPNGKVLVAGGFNLYYLNYLTTAELYDPAAGTWTGTGSMATGHFGHTATLLPNSKVLVTGGVGDDSKSAEIYNPAAGTWTGTGSMATARYWHTATLLANGKVLVAGGRTDGYNYAVTARAALYDPAAGTWTNTGSMVTARFDHTATLLPNGQVLVVGGRSESGILNSAELYNPSSGTWTPTGSLGNHYEHTATSLSDGKVLVAGGAYSPDEIYNPATGTWTTTGWMVIFRQDHAATRLPNGKVLAAGGCESNFIYRFSAELYDPAQGNWTLSGSLGMGRRNHTATLLPNGKVLAVGGNMAGWSLNTAELYNAAPAGFSPGIFQLLLLD